MPEKSLRVSTPVPILMAPKCACRPGVWPCDGTAEVRFATTGVALRGRRLKRARSPLEAQAPPDRRSAGPGLATAWPDRSLLASARMTGAAPRTLRPVDARRVERILLRLGALWESPALGGIDVVPNARLSKTLGRLVGRPWRIELGPRALASDKTLREVVTHEAAHAATRDGAEHHPPHGPRWRALMARAGYPKANAARWRCYKEAASSPQREHQPKAKAAPPTLYDHWCPVCQSSRVGRRPVKTWRCVACVAAGLDGRLEITRRTARSHPKR